MRTSWALGGATSTSSTERGSPAPQATAAYKLVGILYRGGDCSSASYLAGDGLEELAKTHVNAGHC